jgi:hypothetical protein
LTGASFDPAKLQGAARIKGGLTIDAEQPLISPTRTTEEQAVLPAKRGESVTRKLLVIAFLGVAAMACRSALAHHGQAAYDVNKIVTIKGTVTRWIWSNPHCILFVDATDDHGQVIHWIGEVQNPLSMSNMGWANDSFKPGDMITLRLTPAKNGAPIGLIADVVLANGHKLDARNFARDEPKTDATPKQ